ncbi:hypothetical protein [Propionicicella superfundia]|uniref:hypothetical protein n=1 Tax=Propionicicella superfundia TaxID=348582 RepID=UPI0003F95710|nr:hypothetical protein [Propionicicella superfundia]
MGQDPFTPRHDQQPPFDPGRAGASQPTGATPAPGLVPPAPGPQSPYSAPSHGEQPGPAGHEGHPPAGTHDPYATPRAPGSVPTAPAQAFPAGAGSFGSPPGLGPTPGTYAGPGAGSPPPRTGRKGLLIGLIAGGAALVLVVALVIVFVVTSIGRSTPSEASGATAHAALQGYLEAVAAGDATAAKGYALNAPPESPLLTDDFLKAAVGKNPITDIQVVETEEYGESEYLTASYKLGDTTVQASYDLTKIDGTWLLNDIVATDDRPEQWGDLDVKINGTPAPDEVALFPGMYELTTGTSLIDWDDTDTLTVKEPGDYIDDLTTAAPQLSDAGEKAMVKASQDWLKQCLAQQSLTPKDCAMNSRLPSGVTMKPGTLKRTVSSSATPFADASPYLSYGDPTTVTMSAYIPIKVDLTGTNGNPYTGSVSISRAVGTIDGEKITVVFT